MCFRPIWFAQAHTWLELQGSEVKKPLFRIWRSQPSSFKLRTPITALLVYQVIKEPRRVQRTEPRWGIQTHLEQENIYNRVLARYFGQRSNVPSAFSMFYVFDNTPDKRSMSMATTGLLNKNVMLFILNHSMGFQLSTRDPRNEWTGRVNRLCLPRRVKVQ